MTNDHCEWPYGDPGEPGYRECGQPVVRGYWRPYCLDHAILSTAPWRRKELLQRLAEKTSKAA